MLPLDAHFERCTTVTTCFVAGGVDSTQAGETPGSPISVTDVEIARQRIANLVDASPVIRSPLLSERIGVPVWLKLENLQPVGSFKIRGAASRLMAMDECQRSRGVVTCSNGNHGAAVAYVAGLLGIPATICVPETTDEVKLRAIRDSGAKAIVQGATFDDAMRVSRTLELQRELSYVHPFDDPNVIAGQGTIGLELIEQIPDLAAVVAGVSGGGLISGIGVALKGRRPSVNVIGASAENAAAMAVSARAGRQVEVPHKDTLADALTGGIGADNRWSFTAVQQYVDDHVLVSDPEIAEAMRFALSAHRVIVEGGGAVAMAAIIAGKLPTATGPVAVVVSGGNVDPAAVLALDRQSLLAI